MNIHESAEDYLEAILKLREDHGMVRSIDIVRAPGVPALHLRGHRAARRCVCPSPGGSPLSRTPPVWIWRGAAVRDKRGARPRKGRFRWPAADVSLENN